MNVFRLSLLYIRSRKLESALGIVGIVLGVATLAGTLSLISSYESYYEIFSRSPESRQLTVSQSSRVRVTDSPAILIGTTELENIRFSGSEAKAALEVCPDLDSFYEAGYRKFLQGYALRKLEQVIVVQAVVAQVVQAQGLLFSVAQVAALVVAFKVVDRELSLLQIPRLKIL